MHFFGKILLSYLTGQPCQGACICCSRDVILKIEISLNQHIKYFNFRCNIQLGNRVQLWTEINLQEVLDDLGLVVLGGDNERRLAELVPAVHVRLLPHEQLHDVRAARGAGRVEGVGAIAVLVVHLLIVFEYDCLCICMYRRNTLIL